MVRLDRRAAWLLAAIFALIAAITVSQALTQALKTPRAEQVSAGGDPGRDPVPNAAAVTGPVLDEARVRQIVREEVAAQAVARRKAPPAPKAKDDDDADDVPRAAVDTPPAATAPVPQAPTPPG